jgi:hypothetical protein
VSKLSFFDKKDLTNGIDWFIPCAMNANEISTKTNPQMKRIRLMSQIIKALLLVYVFASGLIGLIIKSNGPPYKIFDNCLPFASYSEVPATLKIMSAITMVIYLLAVVLLYRLLNLYEQGTVFSLANVCIYKRLGFLAVGYGLLAAYAPAVRPELPILRQLEILLFEATSSSWIIGGFFVVMISIIMKEACKLREEQELTV